MTTDLKHTSISIRQATAEDLAAIEDLLTTNDLPLDGVREALSGFLVAESEDRIVGVVGMEQCGTYGLLRSTAVAADWRNHGIARQLVERIIAKAESQNVRALYLLTTTAEQYFPTFGFRTATRESAPEEIRATDEFRSACPASATMMCLSLSAA
jgi:N-acetylglutamate synthase-like GNAT family acetyltransferase